MARSTSESSSGSLRACHQVARSGAAAAGAAACIAVPATNDSRSIGLRGMVVRSRGAAAQAQAYAGQHQYHRLHGCAASLSVTVTR